MTRDGRSFGVACSMPGGKETSPRAKRPETSRATREAAEQAASSWRPSWEKGHGGTSPTPGHSLPTSHSAAPGVSSLRLPQGEFNRMLAGTWFIS